MLAAGLAAAGAVADALPLLLLTAGVVAAAVGALARPHLLLYLYCAAIPFNFALPPGPAGTITRFVGIVFVVAYLLRRPDALRPRVMPVVAWVLVAWALASCLWATNQDDAFEAWQSLVQLALVTLLVASIVADDPPVARLALWSYSASAVVTAVVAVLAQLQGVTAIEMRASAFEGQDPALFASLVVPAVVFLAGEVGAPGAALPVRAAALAGCAMSGLALALSGTLSAWVGVGAAIALWVVLRRQPSQVFAVAAVACGIAILAASVPGLEEFLAGRAASSVSSGGSGRTEIWAVGLRMFAATPLVGVGLANFPTAFDAYAIAHAPGALSQGGVLVPGRGAHNLLIGTGVEIGLVGLGLLLLFLVAVLLRASRNGDARAVLVLVALASLLVQSMFLDILMQKQLWLLIGLALGLGATKRPVAPIPSRAPGRVP